MTQKEAIAKADIAELYTAINIIETIMKKWGFPNEELCTLNLNRDRIKYRIEYLRDKEEKKK